MLHTAAGEDRWRMCPPPPEQSADARGSSVKHTSARRWRIHPDYQNINFVYGLLSICSIYFGYMAGLKMTLHLSKSSTDENMTDM